MTDANAASHTNRRQFLQRSGALAVGAAVLGSRVPNVHAAEENTIRLALIGCGGRGSGAVGNAINTSDQGPIQLFAAADIDASRMDGAVAALENRFPDHVNVPQERRFVGFDAYKRAIDSLRPGDVAMCTTRAYIRSLHVEYAVKKGINVFMEKPFASDPMGLRRILRAGEEAEKKGVKIAAGLQCRHSPARAALIDKINSGEMGELSYIRANRLGNRRWMNSMGDQSNLLTEQLKFGKINLLWVGSGHMVDNLIHQIDECYLNSHWHGTYGIIFLVMEGH